jgi:hypothetical protein
MRYFGFHPSRSRGRAKLCAWVLIGLVAAAGAHGQQTVDGILAVVDQEVVTLTDFRIAQTFGLYHRFLQESEASPSSLEILDRLIDQKLIIRMTNPDITVHRNELEDVFQRLSEKMGNEAFLRNMDAFDLDRSELSVYIRELVAFRRILDQRFQLAVTVSLKQIETYYTEIYVPQQESQGQEPEPILEILDDLESTLRAQSTRRLIQEWARNLRRQADIQVFVNAYPKYFKSS